MIVGINYTTWKSPSVISFLTVLPSSMTIGSVSTLEIEADVTVADNSIEITTPTSDPTTSTIYVAKKDSDYDPISWNDISNDAFDGVPSQPNFIEPANPTNNPCEDGYRLPTQRELMLMWVYKDQVDDNGSFTSCSYWSATQSTLYTNSAMFVNLGNGLTGASNKNNGNVSTRFKVRCVKKL